MLLIPRAEWKARPPRHVTGIAPDRPSTVHWNGPAVTIRGALTFDHRYCAGIVRGIQNFHMDSRGWSDIAYNFCVCQHGHVFEGRGMNARSGANGTNTGNRSSLAIMYLGGVGNPFPVVTRVAIREVVAWIARSTSAPDAGMAHRDWKSTACPGDTIARWVHGGMPVPNSPTPTPTPITPEIDVKPSTLVILLYGTFLGRTPEMSEIGNWVGVYEVHGEDAVVSGIANSDEAVARRES